MCYSVQEGTSIRLRSRWELCGLDLWLSTFLGVGKVPSVNTVRESGAWHRLQSGGEGVKHPLLSLAPRGEWRGWGGQRDAGVCIWGGLCPSLVRAEDGLWS